MSFTTPTTSQRFGPIVTRAAHRAAVRPQAARQRLVHQGHARTGRRVAIVEFPPRDQAGAERLEVARADEGRGTFETGSADRSESPESRTGLPGLLHPGSGGTSAGLAATTPGSASSRRITSR